MSIKQLGNVFAIAGLSLIAVGAVASQANAGEIVGLPASFSDIQFNNLITTGEFTEKFVVSARIGGSSTYETGILRPNQSVAAQADRTWTSGQAVDFSLEYDGAMVKYVLGGQTISSSIFSGPASDIFFRTRSTANSTSLLSNMSFTDASGTMAVANLASSGNGTAGDLDYLRLGKVQGAFKLTGKTTMSWTGTRPTNSNLIAQFKVGNSKSTPEPATLGALALVAGSAAIARRAKRRNG
jgi:hypothetical protein